VAAMRLLKINDGMCMMEEILVEMENGSEVDVENLGMRSKLYLVLWYAALHLYRAKNIRHHDHH
jgi:hypothetical protein